MRKQEIKNNIMNLNFVLLGTILKKYKQCGKKSCRCMREKKYWHGPYYIWTRKENGKTITKTLSKQQVKKYRKAFQNMKKLKKYIKIWQKISIEYIEDEL